MSISKSFDTHFRSIKIVWFSGEVLIRSRAQYVFQDSKCTDFLCFPCNTYKEGCAEIPTCPSQVRLCNFSLKCFEWNNHHYTISNACSTDWCVNRKRTAHFWALLHLYSIGNFVVSWLKWLQMTSLNLLDKYGGSSPNFLRPISYFGNNWELYVLDLKTNISCRKKIQLHFPMNKGLTVPK